MIMRRRFFCSCLVISLFALHLRAADSVGQPEGGKAAAPKSFQIRNQKYGSLLRPEEANSANGTPIVLYPAQPWKCMTWRLHPAGESRFQLQNHFTSKTFAAAAGDQAQAAVTQVPFGKKAEERPTWQFTKLNNGAYKITEAKSGKALTALKEENRSGVRIAIQDWHESENQKWELIEIDPKDLTM